MIKKALQALFLLRDTQNSCPPRLLVQEGLDCYKKTMDKREKCKELMRKFFGEASAEQVDGMGDDFIATCRSKVAQLLGEDLAKEFDTI